jgi:hypothetical protein
VDTIGYSWNNLYLHINAGLLLGLHYLLSFTKDRQLCILVDKGHVILITIVWDHLEKYIMGLMVEYRKRLSGMDDLDIVKHHSFDLVPSEGHDLVVVWVCHF